MTRRYCPGYASIPCPSHAWWDSADDRARKRCEICAQRVQWVLPEHPTACAFCHEPFPERHAGRPRIACDRDECQRNLRHVTRTGRPPRPSSTLCLTCGAEIPLAAYGPIPDFCSRRCRYHRNQRSFTFALPVKPTRSHAGD